MDMGFLVVQQATRPSLPRLQWLIATVLVGSYMISAAVTLYNAHADQANRLIQLKQTVQDLSSLLDREVATSRALLQGLSSSPALASGDIRAFHAQMLRTPHPAGMALVLADRERQLANVLAPYGTPLPELSAYKPQPGFFELLEKQGVHVSSRVEGRLQPSPSTVISIKVPGEDGHLKYLLCAGISSDRLLAVLQGEALQQEAGLLVIDAMGQVIASRQQVGAMLRTEDLFSAVGMPPTELVAKQGVFPGTDLDGTAIHTAFVRSALTGWTIAATQPETTVALALHRAIPPLAGAGLMVIMALLGFFLFLRRWFEAPFESMDRMLDRAHQRIRLLIESFQSIRRQEQKRIAQELHDTTAQHLVAAGLQLSALRHSSGATHGLAQQVEEIQDLLDQSLTELRTFAFLLRPPALDQSPFNWAMVALAQGFANRTGHVVKIAIAESANHLPPAAHNLFYRVLQEALVNIQRHAHATCVDIELNGEDERWELAIQDNGRGGISFPAPVTEVNGLGIQGIVETIEALDGTLHIEDTGEGTLLRARLHCVE
ncbi:histidine kinase [Pseudomonas sp. AOB-7]|uniref:sensor histidine kinase n=1 Tax=Pseudomonas sp. AOB-7 TaxID=2482750 RepID=UPI0013141DAB|nr:histidine kinase [Pseudomonas sp. AOB-7]